MGNGGKIRAGLLIWWMVSVVASGALAGTCREDHLSVRGDWGQADFAIELADTEAERARGLMFRKHMNRDAGMLFVYDAPRPVAFWMKNTLIPLDMIFADRTGTVRHVHHMAKPHDETPIFGGDGILAVLEINGGLARRLGLDAGSEMRHPAFDADAAAWPC